MTDDDNIIDAEVVEEGYTFNKELARLDVRVVPDDGVIDAEVVGDEAPEDRYPDSQPGTGNRPIVAYLATTADDGKHHASVLLGKDHPVPVDNHTVETRAGTAQVTRVIPTRNECWWRLYSTPTSPLRGHQDHGVRGVWTFPRQPHALKLLLDDDTTVDWWVLGYKINDASPEVPLDQRQITGKPSIAVALLGPDSIDILAEERPHLPGRPRYWQQITKHGQLIHPGDDRDNWTWDDNVWRAGPAWDPRGGWEDLGTIKEME